MSATRLRICRPRCSTWGRGRGCADGIEWHGDIERIRLGLDAAGATNVREQSNAITATVDGVERTFYIVGSGHGSRARDRLAKIGADVAPVNTDPSRKQWRSDLGSRSIEVHEAPRTHRLHDATPATSADDVARARAQAEVDRAAFIAWQAHVQAKLEALPFVRTRHLQKGLGPAGVMNQALQPPELAGLAIGERLVVTADLTSVLETRGAQPIGQHAKAIDSPAIPVAEHSLANRPGEFVTSDDFAAAMARGRAQLQANVLTGKAGTVERRPGTPGPDWLDPTAALRVWVTTTSGKRLAVYADRIDDLSGPGAPTDAPLRAIMDPAVLAEGQRDGSIVAGAALDLRDTLRPGGRILSIPGSPTADWAAEAGAYLGPTTRVDLVGNVHPRDQQLYASKLEAARASGDPEQVAAVVREIEQASHPGLSIPRNQKPGAAGDHAQISVQVGRPMKITRRGDGKYEVTMHAVIDERVETTVYDQIIYAYGQDKTAAMTEAFGPGARGDGAVPEGTLAFAPVYHDGVYVGLKMVGSDYFLPGPAASPSLAPWIVASERQAWLHETRQIAARGKETRDHGTYSDDSHGVHDGLEAQRERIGLANEAQALTRFALPGTDVELHLGGDKAAWRGQLERFFQRQLPASPEHLVRVSEIEPGVVFAVDIGDNRLGVVRLFAEARAADVEQRVLRMLEGAKLERLQVVRQREQLAVDAGTGVEHRALLTDAAQGESVQGMIEALPREAAPRAEAMERVAAAVHRVAVGLVDLHAHYHNESASTPEARRALRHIEVEATLAKLHAPDTTSALGRGNAIALEAALRQELVPVFLVADVPPSAYHGDARAKNFKVDGFVEGKGFAKLATDDVGELDAGLVKMPNDEIKGTRAAAGMDAAAFVRSLDDLVRAGALHPHERDQLAGAFRTHYVGATRRRPVELSGETLVAAERWYAVVLDLEAATKGDAAARARLLSLNPFTEGKR